MGSRETTKTSLNQRSSDRRAAHTTVDGVVLRPPGGTGSLLPAVAAGRSLCTVHWMAAPTTEP